MLRFSQAGGQGITSNHLICDLGCGSKRVQAMALAFSFAFKDYLTPGILLVMEAGGVVNRLDKLNCCWGSINSCAGVSRLFCLKSAVCREMDCCNRACKVFSCPRLARLRAGFRCWLVCSKARVCWIAVCKATCCCRKLIGVTTTVCGGRPFCCC